MKVALICFGNMKEAPYIRVYSELLDKNLIDFDLIYWNRNAENESIELHQKKSYAWNTKVVNASSIWSKVIKIPSMIRYGNFAASLIDNEKYDYVVIFTSLLGIMMKRYLVKNLDGRYIFDIRDHSYEQFHLYYKWMDELMRHSALNVVSSIGFREFLPSYDTIICHNYSIYEFPKYISPISRGSVINISYIGLIRYSDEYIDFINKIGNNKRICFHFYGYGGHEERIKSFCRKMKYENICFHGPYSLQDKNKILNSTDVVFNVYGNDLHVKYAVSNKYYDSLVFNRPMIVSPGTTMQKITDGFSFPYEANSFSVDEFISWYDSLNYSDIVETCSKRLDEVLNDRNNFDSKVTKILRSGG